MSILIIFVLQITGISAVSQASNLITWKEYMDAGSVAAACFGPGGIVVAVDQESSSLKLWRDGSWEIHKPPALLGDMKQPTGVAVTSDGTIYISDTGNDRILKVTNSGKWKKISYGSGTGAGYFNRPRGITVDDAGIIYVADYKNDRVQYFDDRWHIISGTLSGPIDVAIDNNKKILIADFNNDRIAVYNRITNTWSQYQNNTYLRRPTGVACTSNGTVIVSSITTSSVVSRSNSGRWAKLLESPKVSSPCALATDDYDNIYISDIALKKVLRSKCSNTQIKNLKIDDDSISPQNSMQYTVDANTQNVKIEVQSASPYSKISGIGNVELASGENIFTITVLPESGVSVDYKLNITRQIEIDMSLTSLTIDGQSIEGFTPIRSDYSILLPYENETIVIDAVPISTMTEVKGNGEISLDEGENIIKIQVVAQDGESQVYTLNIVRLEAPDISPSPSPENLMVTPLPITLSPDTNGDGLPDDAIENISINQEKNTGITISIIIISIIVVAMIIGILYLLYKRYTI